MSKPFNKIKEFKELFSGWAIFFHLVFYFVLNVAYLYVLTRNTLISLLVAIPAALLLFDIFSLLNKKLSKRRLILQEINKYTTSLTFYLNSGQNVLYALENTLPYVHPILHEDIEKTLYYLTKEARLVTTHFEKYGVTSLDLFHQTLQVKYEKGGNSKEMFMKPFQGVQFEIKEIDSLYRSKVSIAQQIYVMIAFACGIAGIVAFLPGDLYPNFLSLPTSIPIILIFYICILMNLRGLQKDKADISLRI